MTPTSVSSLESADSASPLRPVACELWSSASGTPTDSATSPTTGPECPSSGMSTTWTPSSAQLWPTSTVNDATGSKYCYDQNREPILKLPGAAEAHLCSTPRSEKTSSENPATWQARNDAGDVATPPLAMSASLHSSSPLASLASQPVPPASDSAREMTAGSGRRLSAWLKGSDPVGASLRTLLDSPRWHSPLRSLAWTLKGYGGVPDEPCAKSSGDLTFWDMTSARRGWRRLIPVVPAVAIGAFHGRDRLFLIARRRDVGHATGGGTQGLRADGREEPSLPLETGIPRCSGAGPCGTVDAGHGGRREQCEPSQRGVQELGARRELPDWSTAHLERGADGITRATQPGLCLLAHGIPRRVAKLRGFGNAVVPQVAAQIIAAIVATEI